MSAFDRVIGYKSIKTELMQVCDNVKNKELYASFGAEFPKGIMLYGDPGLGKTLMAKCFVEECGLPTYIIRRDKGEGEFEAKIASTFEKARANAPCVVLLDDLDKFANEDDDHIDASEYVAVQSGIDDVRDSEVIVIATVNEMRKLPKSLRRTGRFDRKIQVPYPSDEDAAEIIRHYMEKKKVSEDINTDDIVKMIGNNACSVLETVLNEAAINAAYERSESIGMNHIVNAALRLEYDCPDDSFQIPADELKKVAMHEAGHVVIAEVLQDECIGLASVKSSGRNDSGGFVHRCADIRRRPINILVSIAGKAATELKFPKCASGCSSDISRAVSDIRQGMSENGTYGFGLCDMSCGPMEVSSQFLFLQEGAVQAELNRYYLLAKEILMNNMDFLEKTAEALAEKETLLFSEIQKIKKTCRITPMDV